MNILLKFNLYNILSIKLTLYNKGHTKTAPCKNANEPKFYSINAFFLLHVGLHLALSQQHAKRPIEG